VADFTKNITNAVNVFGLNPSSKWGQANFPYTMTWGTDKWGEGSDAQTIRFTKVYNNDQPATSAVTPAAQFIRTIDVGSCAGTFGVSSENLNQGDWRVVFTSDTTDLKARDFATWTSHTVTDATFTCAAGNSTSWSVA
jgi:hypothetical protein